VVLDKVQDAARWEAERKHASSSCKRIERQSVSYRTNPDCDANVLHIKGLCERVSFPHAVLFYYRQPEFYRTVECFSLVVCCLRLSCLMARTYSLSTGTSFCILHLMFLAVVANRPRLRCDELSRFLEPECKFQAPGPDIWKNFGSGSNVQRPQNDLIQWKLKAIVVIFCTCIITPACCEMIYVMDIGTCAKKVWEVPINTNQGCGTGNKILGCCFGSTI